MIRPLGFLFDFDNFPLTRELVENVRLNRPGTRRTPFNAEDPGQYNPVDQYRNDAYGLARLERERWTGRDAGLYRETRYIGRANLDWQANPYSRVRAGWGGDPVLRSDATNPISPVRAMPTSSTRSDGMSLSSTGSTSATWCWSAVFGTTATRRAPAGRSSSIPCPAAPTFGTYLNLPGAAIYETGGPFENRPLVISRSDRSHGYLSPRIQVSFPLSDRTSFRLSYAHQVQDPDFALVLLGVNLGGLGADLDFGKTISFEFGVRHAFSDDMVLDVAAYNRDNIARGLGADPRSMDPVRQRRTIVTRVTNADFGNTRGLDVRLDRRFGNWFNGTISYSYQNARSTGSIRWRIRSGRVALVNAVGGVIGPPPQAILPTALSRPHDVAGTVSLTVPAGWKPGASSAQCSGALGSTRRSSTPAGRRTPPAGTPKETRVPSPTSSGLRPVPRGGEQRAASVIQAVRPAGDQRLRARPRGAHRLSRRSEPLQLHQRPPGVLRHGDRGQSRREHETAGRPTARSSPMRRGHRACRGGRSDRPHLRWSRCRARAAAPGSPADLRPAAPNCVYLIRAEERFGDGDHVFTVDEQRRASDAFYRFERGIQNFTDDPAGCGSVSR